MPEIQKAITGAVGALAGGALALSKSKEEKEEKAAEELLQKKREEQKDLEHKEKVELLEAKKEEVAAEKARKDAILESKLKEASIKQEGLKTKQGQEAEIRRLQIGEQRNRVLTSIEKLELMRARAKDSLDAARDSKRKGAKAFKISDRLSSLQKKRR